MAAGWPHLGPPPTASVLCPRGSISALALPLLLAWAVLEEYMFQSGRSLPAGLQTYVVSLSLALSLPSASGCDSTHCQEAVVSAHPCVLRYYGAVL